MDRPRFAPTGCARSSEHLSDERARVGTAALPAAIQRRWPSHLRQSLSCRLGAPIAVGLDLGGCVRVLPALDARRKPVNAGIAFGHEPLAGVPPAPAFGAAEHHDWFGFVAKRQLPDAAVEQLLAPGLERCRTRTRHPNRTGDRAMRRQPWP